MGDIVQYDIVTAFETHRQKNMGLVGYVCSMDVTWMILTLEGFIVLYPKPLSVIEEGYSHNLLY